MDDIDLLSINTIRTLSIDAVQKANSGHPGAPMGMAPVAYTVWQDYLRYDPTQPLWPNRDRFILSAGHASMLLYSMLHLTKVQAVNEDYEVVNRPAVSMDDIKTFRQPGSACPGHPEYHFTSGVEATTGPLGQGVSMSVGMAIAEKWLATRYNKQDHTLIDYNIYALCSDGEMMEGVASEAASLAGHLKLDNLCWLYDSNEVTLDGPASWTFSEDVATRFLAYGWNVVNVRDANSIKEIRAGIDAFLEEKSRPTLIIVDSHIGYGSPNKQDSNKSHGEPLGAEEVRLTKKNYGWPEDAQFLVPDGVYENFANGMGKRGAELRSAWDKTFASYKSVAGDLAGQFEAMEHRLTPEDAAKAIPVFPADAKGLATRDSSGKVENALAQHYPWMLGGSADLDGSTKTRQIFEGSAAFTPTDRSGRNLHFGVREHAMGAICNGLALSKIRPYASTFLIFSDYLRPTLRLAALMELPTIFIFTHDSISVGEDGPTHQPVEQVASLRCIPGMITLRPGDANEVAEAWRVVLGLKHQPATFILSRQPLPTIDREKFAAASGVAKGAYVLADPEDGKPEVILIGTGSELSLALQGYETLKAEGIKARVVSMPSWELFEMQDKAYQDSVFPAEVPARVAIEQGSTMGWERYTGRLGAVIGMHSFGASAPMKDLLTKFGFTPEKVVEIAKQQIANHKHPKAVNDSAQ
ncbi:transketolase [Lichenihabitans psoromatis]|uniref:transketolase n=1 Tax=Lichenihabitans psoromatis TaxID=2528642 RepID=UPI0010383A6F|nr:transketolase [Lichenihabitans psoromatis]